VQHKKSTMIINHAYKKLKSGGQFAVKQGGQFQAKYGGQFKKK
jgi:hypothetical protein